MSSSLVTPKIVLAYLKRRTALCQRRAQVLASMMALAGCCADPGDRKAYAATLSAATASLFKALVAGETFTHLGIPSGRTG